MVHGSLADDHDCDVTSLLQAAAAGDGAAWVEIVERYGRRVFALAQSRCRNIDVAEEITQSVFVTVAAKVGSGEYTEQGRFEQWLFRVAMNRIRDHIRRIRRRLDTGDEATLNVIAARESDASNDTERVREITLLRSAMDALSDQDREIVELRHHGGLSFKQISDLLEEPQGTLLARHHRALKKLRETIESLDSRPEIISRLASGFTSSDSADNGFRALS